MPNPGSGYTAPKTWTWTISGGQIKGSNNTWVTSQSSVEQRGVTVRWTSTTSRSLTVTITGWANGGTLGATTMAPAVRSVSGGGEHCGDPGSGYPVSVSNVEAGVTYGLYGPSGFVSSKTGSAGSTLTWTGNTACGTYTVQATSCATPVPMSGSATIAITPYAADRPVGGGGARCANGPGLPVQISNIEGGVSYRLQGPNGVVSTQQGSPGSTLTWPNNTAAGTYIVLATRNNACNSKECTVLMNTSAFISISPNAGPPVPQNNWRCGSGPVTLSAALPSDGVSFRWYHTMGDTSPFSLASNISESVSAGTTVTKFVSAVSANGCEGSRVPVTGTAYIIPTPPAIVETHNEVCLNQTRRFRVAKDLNTDRIQWSSGSGYSIALVPGTNGQQIDVTFFSSGSFTLTGTPFSPAPYNCVGAAVNIPVFVPAFTKKITDTFVHSELSAGSPAQKTLYVNVCEEIYGNCPRVLKFLKIYAQLDLGDVYRWGKNHTFQGQVSVQIRGLNSSGAAIFTQSGQLKINATTPEQLIYYPVTDPTLLAQVRSIEILPSGYTFTNALRIDDIRLKAWYEEEYEQNAQAAVVTLNSPVITGWDAQFSWSIPTTSFCPGISNYQLQVMRLYGSNVSQLISSLTERHWSNSLSVEVGGAAGNIQLTLAEGTAVSSRAGSGIYVWRVRAIGTLAGGITNPQNWGNWSLASFEFTQPEEDKNWIYNRTFTEENKLSEQLTYANGLQQVSQKQARLQTDNFGQSSQLIVTQTMRDLAGRDALTTLPVPVKGQSQFGFRTDLLRKTVAGSTSRYTTKDFDENPFSAALATVEGDYYTGNDEVQGGKIFNDRVASAEGYPYTRTLFTNDGTGRIKEQAGAGQKHSLAGQRTIKTHYTSPGEYELVRLFGDEAPANSNVQKIVTSDANGTASVVYQNKDGKVLATALLSPATTNVLPLGTAINVPITEEVTGKILTGLTEITTRKPLFFTSGAATTVTINYEITPAAIAAICNSACKACDYTIDIILRNPEPAGAETPETILRTITIPPGADCASIAKQIAPVTTVSLRSMVNYTLEKRVRVNNRTGVGNVTYLTEYVDAAAASYEASLNTALSAITQFLNDKNLAGLYQHLETMRVNNPTVYSFDAVNNEYKVVITTGTGCIESITIPKEDLCPNELAASDCSLNGFGYAEYFNNHWAGKPYATLDANGKLQFVYFKNKHTNTNILFTPSEFNTMMSNLLRDNPLLGNCQNLWNIWLAEVESYGNLQELPEGSSLSGSVGANTATFENNLLDRLFRRVEEFLLSQNITNPTAVDVCSYDNTYYIRKDTPYGNTFTGTVQPNLLEIYRYFYLNINIQRVLDAHTKILADAGQPSFESLPPCWKFKYSRMMDQGDFATADTQAVLDQRRQETIDKCYEACEMRREEFRQALINSIFSANPSAKIEKYDVQFYSQINRYSGQLDLSLTSGPFTYTLCEFDGMVDALVKNCKNNYCQLSYVRDGSNNIVSLGTPAEIEKVQKVLTHNFEVAVGGSCAPGWEVIAPGAGVTEYSRQLVNCLIPDRAADTYLRSKIDVNGNVYIFGRFRLWVKLNNDVTLVNEDHDVTNVEDFFVAKFNAGGTLLWFKEFNYNLIRPNQASGLPTYTFNENPGTPDNSIVFVTKIDGVNVMSDGPDVLTIDNQKVPGTGTGPYLYHLVRLDGAGNVLWDEVTANSWFGGVTTGFTMTDFWPESREVSNANIFFDIHYPANIVGRGFSVDKRSGVNGNIISAGSVANVTYTGSLPFSDFSSAFSAVTPSGELIVAGQYYSVNTSDFVVDGVSRFQTSGHSLPLFKFNSNGLYQMHNVVPFTTTGGTGTLYVGRMLLQYGSQMKIRIWIQSGGNYKITIAGITLNAGEWLEADVSSTLVLSNAHKLPVSGAVNLYINSIDANYDAEYNSSTGELTPVDKLTGVRGSPLLFNTNEDGFGFSIHRNSPSEFLAIGWPATDFNCDVGLVKYTSSTACQQPLCFRFTNTRPDNPVAGAYNPTPIPCGDVKVNSVLSSINAQVANLVSTKREQLRAHYLNSCADPAKLNDKMTISYSSGMHHYTLYYYDRAGNLIRTIAPRGVVPLTQTLATARNTATNHGFKTEYEYNSLGQMIRQHTPDGNWDANSPADYVRPLVTATESQKNASKYYANLYYNDKGMQRFAQNARQKAEGTYSYTKYDELGKIVEVGKASGYDETALYANRNNNNYPASSITTEITATAYSQTFSAQGVQTGGPFILPSDPRTGAVYTQRYLRNRVSYSYTDDDGNLSTTSDRTYTIYSYDPHGNVEWVIQGLPDFHANGQMRFVAIRYDYDLLSGNVVQVSYNPGYADQFYHRYTYDADKRISNALTSRDGIIWDKDASYEYYPHGPLKRNVIGEDGVQGTDYTYTIHGWLKALNHPSMSLDPGADGGLQTAADAFSMELAYYRGDYLHTGITLGDATKNYTLLPLINRDLYNGNISAWSSNIYSLPEAKTSYKGLTGYVFEYDELNRLRTGSFRSHSGTAYVNITDYQNTITYDPNGNIVKNIANGTGTSLSLDNMDYAYYVNKATPRSALGSTTDPATSPYLTNRLSGVVDNVVNSPFEGDVESGQASDSNYEYDQTGNLIKDRQQKIDITWTIYGKVRSTANTQTSSTYTFRYDASGNRVMKKYVNTAGLTRTSYYVRDVEGNVMAEYEKVTQGGNTEIVLSEHSIYGSERIGVNTKPVSITAPIGGGSVLEDGEVRITGNAVKTSYENTSYLVNGASTLTLGAGFTYASTSDASQSFSVRMGPASTQAPVAGVYSRELNKKLYEINDHLNNVRAVVTDQREAGAAVAGIPQSYKPELAAYYNYYPFGMHQPSRTWTNGINYRYGFNGKERDDAGEFGNTNYDYGFRIYNPGLGKFLSVDPLTKEYPELTPYQFASNTPIVALDRDGLELYFYQLEQVQKNGKTVLKVGTQSRIENFSIGVQDVLTELKVDVIKIDFSMLQIKETFVPKDGDWVRLTDGYTIDNLPEPNDPIWDEFESYDTYKENLQATVDFLLGFKIPSKGAANSIKNGLKNLKSSVNNLSSLRRKAVRDAWKQERELIRKTGKGTRQWSREEIAEMEKTGKVKGYEGHHINSVKEYPSEAGNPNNIKFVKGRKEHLQEHDGSFKNPTSGDMIDREQMMKDWENQ